MNALTMNISNDIILRFSSFFILLFHVISLSNLRFLMFEEVKATTLYHLKNRTVFGGGHASKNSIRYAEV